MMITKKTPPKTTLFVGKVNEQLTKKYTEASADSLKLFKFAANLPNKAYTLYFGDQLSFSVLYGPHHLLSGGTGAYEVFHADLIPDTVVLPNQAAVEKHLLSLTIESKASRKQRCGFCNQLVISGLLRNLMPVCALCFLKDPKAKDYALAVHKLLSIQTGL